MFRLSDASHERDRRVGNIKRVKELSQIETVNSMPLLRLDGVDRLSTQVGSHESLDVGFAPFW